MQLAISRSGDMAFLGPKQATVSQYQLCRAKLHNRQNLSWGTSRIPCAHFLTGQRDGSQSVVLLDEASNAASKRCILTMFFVARETPGGRSAVGDLCADLVRPAHPNQNTLAVTFR